jgi:hypothetical protein
LQEDQPRTVLVSKAIKEDAEKDTKKLKKRGRKDDKKMQ